jgi:hypothetical protein
MHDLYANYTRVFPNPLLREMRVLVARAMPTLTWRHHGIGVLQAYLTEQDQEVRVHLWHPDFLARDAPRIHDHRFEMRSSVLLGELEHTEFVLREDPRGVWQRWSLTHARAGITDPPVLEPGYFAADITMGCIKEGEVYGFPMRRFHTTRVDDLCVTLVTKVEQCDLRSMLLAPRGTTPSHGFLVERPAVDIPARVAEAAARLME